MGRPGLGIAAGGSSTSAAAAPGHRLSTTQVTPRSDVGEGQTHTEVRRRRMQVCRYICTYVCMYVLDVENSLKFHYRHRTGTTRIQINTSIYRRPSIITVKFTGIYIAYVYYELNPPLPPIYRAVGSLYTPSTTAGNGKTPACR